MTTRQNMKKIQKIKQIKLNKMLKIKIDEQKKRCKYGNVQLDI